MNKDISFTKALSRLEEIVSKLENQNIDLEQQVDLLSEGISLHKLCQEKLQIAQDKVEKLLEENKE